jgi:hypothetical protein
MTTQRHPEEIVHCFGTDSDRGMMISVQPDQAEDVIYRYVRESFGHGRRQVQCLSWYELSTCVDRCGSHKVFAVFQLKRSRKLALLAWLDLFLLTGAHGRISWRYSRMAGCPAGVYDSGAELKMCAVDRLGRSLDLKISD